MNNRRSIFWLLLLLGLTLSAHVLLHYQGGLKRSLVQRTRLLNDTAHEALRIKVTRADSPEALLVRTRTWRLMEPYTSRVDENVVLRLLDTLSTTEIDAATGDQELLRLGRTREDFGLENPSVTVQIFGPDEKLSEISFGSINPAGDGCYVSVAGENAVYVVSTNALAAVDFPPEGFRRRSLFPISQEDIVAFDIKQGHGSLMRFVREGDLWQMTEPQKATASAVRIKKLLADVMAANVSSFVWPTGAPDEPTSPTTALLAGYGLDPESAVTLTLKCEDGLDRQIVFGKTAGENLVYALAQGADAVVTVPAMLKDAALAETSAFTDTRLFPLESSAVTRVSIADAEATYLLAREEKGGTWILEAPVAAATDFLRVKEILSRILSLRQEDEVAANGVTVSVSPGEKSFVVARDAVLKDVRLEDLRSREILKLEPSTIRRLVLTPGGDVQGESTAIVYDVDRRAWNVESAPVAGIVDEAAVEQVLKALSSLQADSIVKLKVNASELRQYGLDKPAFTVAIDRREKDAVRRNLLIGGIAPGGRFATVGASDAIFVLSESVVAVLETPLITVE